MQGERIKGFFIKPHADFAEVREVVDDLQEYYKLLECRYVRSKTLTLKSGKVNVICDDDGALKPNLPSIRNKNFQPVVVGSAFIVGDADEEGELTSLTHEQIVELKGKVCRISAGEDDMCFLMV